MNGTKSLLASRGIWTSIIGTLLGLAAMLGWLPEGTDPETVVGAILTIIALATGIFRARATKALPTAPVADTAIRRG